MSTFSSKHQFACGHESSTLPREEKYTFIDGSLSRMCNVICIECDMKVYKSSHAEISGKYNDRFNQLHAAKAELMEDWEKEKTPARKEHFFNLLGPLNLEMIQEDQKQYEELGCLSSVYQKRWGDALLAWAKKEIKEVMEEVMEEGGNGAKGGNVGEVGQLGQREGMAGAEGVGSIEKVVQGDDR